MTITFVVSVSKSKTHRVGWAVKPRFQITLHKKDKVLLEMIKASFKGVGKISQNGSAIYSQVISLKDFLVIIEHFDKYPLLTQKQADFLFFKSIVGRIERGEHLTSEGLRKIVTIRASINKGLSEKLKAAFPEITSGAIPNIELPEKIDPNWLAGFTEGKAVFLLLSINLRLKLALQLI